MPSTAALARVVTCGAFSAARWAESPASSLIGCGDAVRAPVRVVSLVPGVTGVTGVGSPGVTGFLGSLTSRSSGKRSWPSNWPSRIALWPWMKASSAAFRSSGDILSIAWVSSGESPTFSMPGMMPFEPALTPSRLASIDQARHHGVAHVGRDARHQAGRHVGAEGAGEDRATDRDAGRIALQADAAPAVDHGINFMLSGAFINMWLMPPGTSELAPIDGMTLSTMRVVPSL